FLRLLGVGDRPAQALFLGTGVAVIEQGPALVDEPLLFLLQRLQPLVPLRQCSLGGLRQGLLMAQFAVQLADAPLDLRLAGNPRLPVRRRCSSCCSRGARSPSGRLSIPSGCSRSVSSCRRRANSSLAPCRAADSAATRSPALCSV